MTINFKQFLYEASIDEFMGKYYKKRVKETELKDTDDISVRDALAGKRAELEDGDEEAEEEF